MYSMGRGCSHIPEYPLQLKRFALHRDETTTY
jgi:hypothetical protein